MWAASRSITIAILALFTSSALAAEPEAGDADLVRATLLADAETIVPGQTFHLGVRLTIKPHWHTYWVNPGESGDATKVVLSGPAGFNFGAVQWPLPSQIEAPGGISYGYEGEVLLIVPVKVAKDASPTGKPTFEADVSWMSCKDTCIEGGAKLAIRLPVGTEAKPANAELFAAWRQRLPIARDQAAASGALSSIVQPIAADGAPQPSFAVQWKEAPRKVEWFPVSTRAASIENVVIQHEGRTTNVRYKPTVYKPEKVPQGSVDGVLVYEDAKGKRIGVTAPVRVPLLAAESK